MSPKSKNASESASVSSNHTVEAKNNSSLVEDMARKHSGAAPCIYFTKDKVQAIHPQGSTVSCSDR